MVEENLSLEKELIKAYGKQKSKTLLEKYSKAWEPNYDRECPTSLIMQDIAFLEKISPNNFIELYFYSTERHAKNRHHLRVYKYDKPIILSEILPILGDFSFQVLSARSYSFHLGKQTLWINDFIISSDRLKGESYEKVAIPIRNAIQAIDEKYFATYKLNELILIAGLTWQEITILHAYIQYLHQTNFRFSSLYIEKALVNNASIVKELINWFKVRHDPRLGLKAVEKSDLIEKKILEGLEKVSNLDDDIIIRQMMALIRATLRTNYFQANFGTGEIVYLSFKFLSKEIPHLPLPVPLYEFFVYSTRFEGIHLRSDKVARGGIRWSDRQEDYRTEILGLMKAQKVKNSIIVPYGAKGGFVLKNLPSDMTSANLQKEGIKFYQLFIKSMLELTDNIKEGKIIKPKDIVCYDGNDPYLVVAADKGTATFSDIANQISLDHKFWLGDAFASGGKTGYDHKKMGITARGAWESVKRHFQTINVDLNSNDLTVVGIGDMSGDVFGNGMIYSNRLKLIAAFDHRNIFLDPSPDPEASYQERLRLFNLPGSTWADYKGISPGGGVYKRSAKFITLSPEVKAALEIKEDQLPPTELIKAILKASVDLLWIGGIGTYVKASNEIQADAGDKANDAVRVNGNELRCKVVGEGGNLGFTQRGRIEYALIGGCINTDFIDNSGGVDCSDHEVNLKIFLNSEVSKGNISLEDRNLLLAKLTPEIADLVLENNKLQARIISYLNKHSFENLHTYQEFINDLDQQGILNRKVEFLPNDAALSERMLSKKGLTNPEIAILLAYTKIYIKQELLKSDLIDEDFFASMADDAFPETINKKYPSIEQVHQLRREITATQISSRIVNEMGILFIYQLQKERGATIPDIVRAYWIASAAFQSNKIHQIIEDFDNQIPLEMQDEFNSSIKHLLNISTRWFLQGNRRYGDPQKISQHYSENIEKLKDEILNLITGMTKTYLQKLIKQFKKLDLPESLAIDIAYSKVAYSSLNIIEVATENNLNLVKMAKMYFAVGREFDFLWFRDRLRYNPQEGAWDVWARLTLRDEMDWMQKNLACVIYKSDRSNKNVEKTISNWVAKNQQNLVGWNNIVSILKEGQTIDYVISFVAMRRLKDAIMS